MSKLPVFIFAFFLSSLSFAQEYSYDIYKHELGANIGLTTGIGFSYRHWFEKTGIQITAVTPIETDDHTYSSMGLTALYSLKKTKYLRVFIYLGSHIFYTKENNPKFINDDSYDSFFSYHSYMKETQEYTQQYNIGFGPGFSFGRTVAFNLMFGYGIYDVANKFNLLPTGEIGVYYMF